MDAKGTAGPNSWPQKRHLFASAKTISAQSGHFFCAAGNATGDGGGIGAGTFTRTCGAGCETSLLIAHTSATTHPTRVQPQKKLIAPIAPTFFLLLHFLII